MLSVNFDEHLTWMKPYNSEKVRAGDLDAHSVQRQYATEEHVLMEKMKEMEKGQGRVVEEEKEKRGVVERRGDVLKTDLERKGEYLRNTENELDAL
jgi:uncharacterized protein YdaT